MKTLYFIFIIVFFMEATILTNGKVSHLGDEFFTLANAVSHYPAWGRKIADDIYKVVDRGDSFIHKMIETGMHLRDGTSEPLEISSFAAEMRSFAGVVYRLFDEMENLTFSGRPWVNVYYAFADELEGRYYYPFLHNYSKK